MNKPRISIIVALSENNVIGNKGEIPWNIPGEQKRVREITTPHPLIMGRKTHEAIGKILPDRLNIIVTSDISYKVEGGEVVHSLEGAIKLAKENEEKRVFASKSTLSEGEEKQSQIDPPVADAPLGENLEIFVFGGANIYAQAIPAVDRLYLTLVHKDYDGDAFFPDYSDFKKVIEREDKEYEGLKYSYLTLEK